MAKLPSVAYKLLSIYIRMFGYQHDGGLELCIRYSTIYFFHYAIELDLNNNEIAILKNGEFLKSYRSDGSFDEIPF
jgi:hypothetical protein